MGEFSSTAAKMISSGYGWLRLIFAMLLTFFRCSFWGFFGILTDYLIFLLVIYCLIWYAPIKRTDGILGRETMTDYSARIRELGDKVKIASDLFVDHIRLIFDLIICVIAIFIFCLDMDASRAETADRLDNLEAQKQKNEDELNQLFKATA